MTNRKGFQIGHKINLNRKRSKETKIKISNIRKELFNEGKLKIIGMKGKHHSEETKQKIRLKAKLKRVPHLEKTKIKISESLLGHKVNIQTRQKIKQARAKQIFPLKDTSIEVKIQNYLKMLGIDFLTHQHIKDIEHGYQCDILIPSMKLVIECDGDYWHKYPIGNEIDHIRTSELLQKGFKVLRLWEHEIKIMDINKFKMIINERRR